MPSRARLSALPPARQCGNGIAARQTCHPPGLLRRGGHAAGPRARPKERGLALGTALKQVVVRRGLVVELPLVARGQQRPACSESSFHLGAIDARHAEPPARRERDKTPTYYY